MQPLAEWLDETLPDDRRKHAVEIGSAAGASARAWAPLFQWVWCIDPQRWADPVLHDVCSRSLADYASTAANVIWIAQSDDAAISALKRLIRRKAKLADFVYIDANHTYDATVAQINRWLDLKPAVIAGHDYHGRWPGVVKAVDEVFPGRIIFPDTSWAVDLTR